MRILGLPDDVGACTYYRTQCPLAALHVLGLAETDVAPMVGEGPTRKRDVVIDRLSAQDIFNIYQHYRKQGKPVSEAEAYIKAYEDPPNILDYDVIVFQRQADPSITRLIKAAKSNGIGVVFDIDDDAFSIPPDNPNYVYWGSDANIVLNWVQRMKYKPVLREYTPRACRDWVYANMEALKANLRAADAVTVSTQPLADVYSRYNKNIHILPNQMWTADWVNVEPVKHPGELWFGWAGSKTHIGDLKEIESVVAQVLERVPNSKFVVVGFPEVLQYMPSVPQNRCIAFDWMPMDEYRSALAGLDVVLAPSKNTTFNRGKSDIRVLEAWLTLRPVVASECTYGPTVREAQGGYVAHDTEEWVYHVVRLLEDEQVRNLCAMSGFGYVGARRTYLGNAQLWADVYSSVIQQRAAA